MRKRFQIIKQTPYTPLILFIVIMSGSIIDAKRKQIAQIGNPSQIAVNEEGDSNQKEESNQTYAQRAIESGTNIIATADNEYTNQVIQDYCNRSVVSCSSSNLVRANEENWFEHSFDQMTGFMNLVKLTVDQGTKLHAFTTTLEGATVVLVFPDRTYVILEQNKQVECDLPIGESMILYIGENLKGSIRVQLENDEHITYKRM